MFKHLLNATTGISTEKLKIFTKKFKIIYHFSQKYLVFFDILISKFIIFASVKPPLKSKNNREIPRNFGDANQ